MFDKDAIQALTDPNTTEAARASIHTAGEHECLAALPDHMTVHDLEKFYPGRRRARGTMATEALASFAQYTHEHAELGTTVFVNTDDMSATAVLNLGAPSDPGHADNTAKLISKRTAAYRALQSMANGSGRKQAEVAEWLEDWAPHIKCFNDAGEISPPRAVAAIRKVTIESLRKLESEEQQLSATTSAFQSVTASSKEPLPTTIYFECQPYHGFGQRTFVLRLSVLTSNDKPAIGLRIAKQEEHDQEMAEELAGMVNTAMLTGSPEQVTAITVLIGTYSAAK